MALEPIFLKYGTNCLFSEEGKINYSLLHKKADEINQLYDQTSGGLVLVVSGAIGLGKKYFPKDVPNPENLELRRQSYSTVGQPKLMKIYEQIFEEHERTVAQVVLTEKDMENKNDIRDLIHENSRCGILTIVNYNDAIDFEGIGSGREPKDNDTFAADLAVYCNSPLLGIFGHYDGLLDKDGNLVRHISKITPEIYSMCKGVGKNGTGGMTTKIQAGEIMLTHGKSLVIGNVNRPLEEILDFEYPTKKTIIRI